MKATDFLKDKRMKTLAEIVQWIREWYGAEAEMSAFDLNDKDDFKMFVDLFGVSQAVAYYETSRYWLYGTEQKPLFMDADVAFGIINDFFDAERLNEMFYDGWDTDETLNRFFNIPQTKEAIGYEPPRKGTFGLNQYEVDWYTQFGVYALNRNTGLYENCSDATNGLVVVYDKDKPDYDVSMEYERLHLSGTEAEYFLYDSEQELVGYAYRNN